MVIGLLLILAGAFGIVAAVLTAEGSGGQLLGFDVTALGLFFAGVASSAAVLCGYTVAKWGAKRSLRQRRESKRLEELSEKLHRVEAERRADETDPVDPADEADAPGDHRR